MRFIYMLPFHECPPPSAFVSGDALSALARVVEDAGFDAVAVTDHPAPPERWRVTGGHDALDPFVALAFAAAATERLKLMTYLVPAAYRNPLLLAKTTASLDALSGGRLLLGMGTGYLEAEFAALGVDFARRNEIFDETIAVLRKAWTGEPVSHDGIGFSAADVTVQPPPVQQPGPPIWIGGNSRRAMRRAVDAGDAWMPMPNPAKHAARRRSAVLESVDDLASRVRELREYESESARSEPVDVVFPLQRPTRAAADEAAAAGVSWAAVGGGGQTVEEATDRIAAAGAELISPRGRG